MDATQVTSTVPESDPTLATLIPQRSIRRNAILASAATLLLVGVWISPQLLRPSVLSNSYGGDATSLAREHQVLATVQLTAAGWTSVGVQSVGDLPGARVAGAWVIPDTLAQPQIVADPAKFTTGLDFLRASFPHVNFGTASRLPHRLDRGESAQLVILWDITDCARLIPGQEPQIELTSILGTTTYERLPDAFGPESALNTQDEKGHCSAP